MENQSNRRPVRASSSQKSPSARPVRAQGAAPRKPQAQRPQSSAARPKTSGARPQQRTASARPKAPAAPQKKPSAPKKGGFRLTPQTAMLIAIAAVILICTPLVIITLKTGSSAKKQEESVSPVDTVLEIAPAVPEPTEPDLPEDPDAPEDGEGTEDGETPDAPKDGKSYSKGMTDPEVARIQSQLMKYGCMPKNDTTELYGPATESAVKLFQQMNNLTADGVVAGSTYEKLFSESAAYFSLSTGVQNSLVSEMQSLLGKLGYLKASSTGYFGSETATAVKNFQTANGLAADGKVGISTWNLLHSGNAKKASAEKTE